VNGYMGKSKSKEIKEKRAREAARHGLDRFI
jgi:hypothetical protein